MTGSWAHLIIVTALRDTRAESHEGELSSDLPESQIPKLGLADLVARVRRELEVLDSEREEQGRWALFVVEELELELQFAAVERADGHGGVDLRIVSVGASKGVESSAIQKIRLKFGLDEEARRKSARGTRAHSSARSQEAADVDPL